MFLCSMQVQIQSIPEKPEGNLKYADVALNGTKGLFAISAPKSAKHWQFTVISPNPDFVPVFLSPPKYKRSINATVIKGYLSQTYLLFDANNSGVYLLLQQNKKDKFLLKTDIFGALVVG